MKTKNLLKYFMVAAIISIIFTACKKKETPAPAPVADNDTTGPADNALAEGTFNDVATIADQGASGGLSSYLAPNENTSGERGILSHCTTVHVDTAHSGNTHTIIVNFGTTPCLCGDGRLRSGIITVTYQGLFHAAGTTLSITFTNYSVNGNVVNGSHTVIRKAPVNGGHPNDSVYVNATIVKYNNGGTITWVSHRTREWTYGYNLNPLDPTKNVFSISGNANWSNSTTSFTETCSNLKIHADCKWIESGQLNLTPAGKPTRYIDFGNDTCDGDATVIINGISYAFTMQ